MPDPAAASHAAAPEATGAAMDRRVGRTRRARLRRWLLPLGGGLLTAAGAGVAVTLVPASGTLAVDGADIATAPVRWAPFGDYLPVRATVAPLRTVFVGAVAGGVVDRVPAQDGAPVRAGEVLAVLSNTALQLDVSSREAAIAGQLGGLSAQRLSLQQNETAQDNAVAEARYTLLKARRELGIRQHLHAQGFESDAGLRGFADEARYDAARLDTLSRARDRDRATAVLQAAAIAETTAGLQRNLAVVRDSLRALTLQAPVAGRLTDFTLQPGQTLKQGDAIGEIDSEDAYRLDADIDEFYLGRVAPGQHAVADLDGRTAALTVQRVRPQVSGGQFRAELVFDRGSPPGLRRGETVEARLTLGATRPALVLPNGPWLEDGGGSLAFVLDASGRHAVRRAITCGRRNPQQVEITAGLSPGDRVVTSAIDRANGFTRLLIR